MANLKQADYNTRGAGSFPGQSRAAVPAPPVSAPAPSIHTPGLMQRKPSGPLTRAPVPASAAKPLPPAAKGKGFGRYALPAAAAIGAGSLLYSAIKGGDPAAEHDARTRDLMASRQHDLNAQMPTMSVYASDNSAENKVLNSYEKVATGEGGPWDGSVGNGVAQGFVRPFGEALANKFVTAPIDKAHEIIKKKFYLEPKHQDTFNKAIEGDNHLQKYHAENPEMLNDAFGTLKKFAPSLAQDKNATRSFLRQAMMAGGQMDYATIRLLAETEKFVQNSKGNGGQR